MSGNAQFLKRGLTNTYETNDENGMKKRRMDDNDGGGGNVGGGSAVVEVINFDRNVTEGKLMNVLGVFGDISYVSIMPGGGHALVEFEDIKSAQLAIDYSRQHPLNIVENIAMLAFWMYNTIPRTGWETKEPHTVLSMKVTRVLHPITVGVIHKITERFGALRISIIRGDPLQALVEFDSIQSAWNAKRNLNGAEIYTGCCDLKVEFANMNHIAITRNSGDNWDFTVGAATNLSYPNQYKNGNSVNGTYSNPNDGYAGAFEYPHRQDHGDYEYQRQDYVGSFQHSRQRDGRGNNYENGHQENYGGYRRRQHSGDYERRGRGRGRDGGYGRRAASAKRFELDNAEGARVIMISGIDRDKVNCDGLFNIFCQYGNVLRVMFMKTKELVLVEMGRPEHAKVAIEKLNRTVLFGNTLVLKVSNHETLHEIRNPFPLSDGKPSFQNYLDSRNHRFTTPAAIAKNRMIGPSNILHWFNAPTTMTEDWMKQICKEAGLSPKKVVVFPKRSERGLTGLVELDTVEEAMEMLVKCNHTAVQSPFGNRPYVMKFSFADLKLRDSKRV